MQDGLDPRQEDPDPRAASPEDPFREPDYRRVVDAVDLDPFLGRAADPTAAPAAEPHLVAPGTPPLLALRDLVRDPRFADLFARALRTTDPAFRDVLPHDAAPAMDRLAKAMDYAFVTTEEAAGDSTKVDEVVEFAHHLGADYRKFAPTPQMYSAFGDALERTLAHLAGRSWTPELERTLRTALHVLTTAMRAGADAEPGPARVGARVVDVRRPTRDVAVVRLVTDEMVDYLPGQYLSVLTPYAHALWRPLSPANPTNPARQIEFHIREVPGGQVSGTLVRGVTPGDRWVVARPLGLLEVDRTVHEGGFRDVLMVAGGTGVAPLQSLLVDMLRFADNPRVHLFYGARHPGELYALHSLVEIAASAPWLTIQPVTEHDEDPWWADPTPELPRTLHRRQTGRLVDVVTGFGTWADRQILVSGSPDMIRATVRGMVSVGTPRQAIAYDPF